jgi:membrane protease YdiL (CAAX protease family)
MLIFIACFPLVTLGIFTLVYAYHYGIKKRAPSEKVIFLVYPTIMLIAFIIVLLDIIHQDWDFQQLGLRSPTLFFEPVWTILIAIIIGIAIGKGLFEQEKWSYRVVSVLTTKLYSNSWAWNQLLQGQTSRFPSTIGLTPKNKLPPLLLFSLIVATCEEFIWRGYLILLLDNMTTDIIIIVALSALMFGSNHLYFGIVGFLNKTLHGFIWGITVVLTESLLISLVSHITFEYLVWEHLRQPGNYQEHHKPA